MRWDHSKGRPTKSGSASQFNLATRSGASRAAQGAFWAAIMVGGTHIALTAIRLHNNELNSVWFSTSKFASFYAAIIVGITVLVFGFLTRRRYGIIPSYVILVASIAQCVPWVTYYAYGFIGPIQLALPALFMAIAGVAGAHALRRHDRGM